MADWYVSSAAWTAIAQFAIGSYSVGQIARPLTAPAFNAQYAFRCITAGSASAEPTWSSAGNNNQTVTATGGAVFQNVSGQSAYGWSAAAGNLYCISANVNNRPAVGDRIYLSSDHAENLGSGINYMSFVGSGAYGLIQILSVNRAGSVPPVAADQVSGAAITMSGTNFFLEAYQSIYWQGVNFTYTGSGNLSFSQSGHKEHYFRNCSFYINTAAGTQIIPSNNVKVIWDNTTLRLSNAGQNITCGGGTSFCLEWINTPSAMIGTAPTNLFVATTGALIVALRGVDISNATSGLLLSTNGATNKVLLDSCRIAAGLTRYNPGTVDTTVDEIELVNCYDGTNILSERHTPAGDLTTDRSATMTGGAQDDVGLFSHKLVSSSRADGFAMTLDGFWIDVENTLTGASHTATVDIISSTTLNNTDISLVLEYLGTSGSSRASFTNSLPSALAASSALGTSTATWNNPPSTPVKQRLQVTFTPQQAGRLRGLVRLGKASTTVWVNPQVTVT